MRDAGRRRGFADRLSRHPGDARGRPVRARGLHGDAGVHVGRSGRRAGQHARVAARRQQQRGRPGSADRHAPRRHALLPAGRQPPRSARDQSRVHRRRPSSHRRHRHLERAEGAQVDRGTRRQRDRGRGPRRPVAGRAPVQVRAPNHCGNADAGRRTGGRSPVDEDCGRPVGVACAGHSEQLRERHHALGHVPDRRGELHLLLQRPRAALGPRTALGTAQGWARLSLARARGAIRRGPAPERAEPVRMGGRDRPLWIRP